MQLLCRLYAATEGPTVSLSHNSRCFSQDPNGAPPNTSQIQYSLNCTQFQASADV